jgi:hypothetical protein
MGSAYTASAPVLNIENTPPGLASKVLTYDVQLSAEELRRVAESPA